MRLVFYQIALPKFWVFILCRSIACLQVEIDTGESSRYVRKAESTNSLLFAVLYKWVPIIVWVPIFMAAYFVWVLIIPILR